MPAELTPTPLTGGRYTARSVRLAGSTFHDVNLQGAVFDDVNLKQATFNNIALSGATFTDVCLSDVSISNANYAGMRIDGILVTELLEAYRRKG